MDHMNNISETQNVKVGKPVILPSSFIGSPRAMQQNYQDAMALVRKYGKPDYFITMTCNPKWKEISENLEEWQKPEYRPDLVARVFKLKLKELQKDLFNIVTKHMIHGPCGICLVDGKCSKQFPKEFTNQTNPNVDGYPKYKRTKGNNHLIKGRQINNSWVVPYNKYLLLKYNCHINVEVCASIKSIKYLFKYVYKGHDCADIEFKEKVRHDEVKSFLDARYVSAPEAMHRIFAFKMHGSSHTVYRLAVHLPDEQYVHFREGKENEALEAAGSRETTLTAWFNLNVTNPSARNLLYSDIPYKFV